MPPHQLEPSDESLVVQAREGSRMAFGLLVERHAAGVLAVLQRRVGHREEPQDLAQDIWIKVLRGLDSFDPGRRFRPWLYSVVLNHVRDRLRRGQRDPLTGVQPLDGTSPGTPQAHPAADPSGRVEERAAIEQALAEVGEPFRTALVLVDVLGLSYDEAAESQQCAPGTVKSRVSRGRSAFRKAYSQEDRPLQEGPFVDTQAPANPGPIDLKLVRAAWSSS